MYIFLDVPVECAGGGDTHGAGGAYLRFGGRGNGPRGSATGAGGSARLARPGDTRGEGQM